VDDEVRLLTGSNLRPDTMEEAQQIEQAIVLVLGLLIVAMAVALIVRRLRLPYTVILVVVGVGGAMALWRQVPQIRLTGPQYAGICYYLLLPALIFEAALNLKWELFARNARPIFGLAILGTIANIGVVGLLCHLFLPLPILVALLLGAIISPTDPLSVVATFRELRVSRRLSVLVEGESLFNDAVGLVVFSVLLVAVGEPGSVSLASGLYRFFVVSAGGVVVGAALGLVASHITRAVDDHLIEVTLSTILAYGAFLLAEYLVIGGVHFSGVIAVVVAGLLMGNYGQPVGMSATTVVALHTFWEYAAFVINSIIFLLIGIELSVLELQSQAYDILTSILIVYGIGLVARAAVSHGGGYLVSKIDRPIPVSWRHMIAWGGLKGALSMIMVLQIPQYWEDFDLLLGATFGVVFLSLMLQGLTLRPLVRLLRLGGRSEVVDRYEALAGRLIAARAALAQLDQLRRSHVLTGRVHEQLAQPYREQGSAAEEEIEQLHLEAPSMAQVQFAEAQHQAHHAEKSALLDAFQRGIISEDVFHDLVSDLDHRHHTLRAERERQREEEA
jgi:CPA1 family monovalent cation:H+ antiporter